MPPNAPNFGNSSQTQSRTQVQQRGQNELHAPVPPASTTSTQRNADSGIDGFCSRELAHAEKNVVEARKILTNYRKEIESLEVKMAAAKKGEEKAIATINHWESMVRHMGGNGEQRGEDNNVVQDEYINPDELI
jgi:hypothetical protein